MAQRFILNGTSYHGAGAIQEIATEVKSRGFKKAFVCSDPDLVKFGVTAKVLKVLDDNGFSYELYSNIKPIQECGNRLSDSYWWWFFYGYSQGNRYYNQQS